MSKADKHLFESPHVGALMDIGVARMALETEAKEAGAKYFGHGYHDYVMNIPITEEAGHQTVSMIMAQDSEAWASVARASLLMAQTEGTHAELLARVKHLAVITTAWLEDIQQRTPIGIEP